MIFSIAMGADYSIELISIETYVPQFIGHNNIFLGRVYPQKMQLSHKTEDEQSQTFDAFHTAKQA